uniref:Hydroxylysine kinase n=1 Tax=Xenopsylla cheopis TaxID=163159 RepID=A0A6M2DKX5_XENCH
MSEPKTEVSTEEKENDSDSNLLRPGVRIKPDIQEDQVRRIAERLYGISCLGVCELNAYDDRNFLIEADPNVRNPIIPNDWTHGYVMKIMNSLDSKKTSFIEGQTELMLFLSNNGIKCPKPVKNVYGKYFTEETLSGEDKNVIRLLEYQPGKILFEVPPSDYLFYQTGEYIANLDRVLQKFNHDAYANHRTMWMLEAVPKLAEFLYAIKDTAKKELIENVIDCFKKNVLAKSSELQKGLIHGDFNEQNILVTRGRKEGEFKVSGVLDFGDSQVSYYVFELAITMTYMMLQTKDLATGGLVIAGYSTVRPIPDVEFKMLKICVAARLCQSLVLGTYSHTQDPSNDYVLTTQKVGWDLLEHIWNLSDEAVEKQWMAVSDTYLKSSTY